MKTEIKLALPAGSLQESTLKLFDEAGIELSLPSRSYALMSADPQLKVRLLRAQEIGKYVAAGKFDVGITGLDWIVESGARVTELADLRYAKRGMGESRWVVAAPVAGEIQSSADLQGRQVVTEVVNLARAYFRERGIGAKVEFSWGATESKAPELADAIVDVTETGSSLRANNLKELDTVFRSTPRVIASQGVLDTPEKREPIYALVNALKAALAAREMLRVEMNVRKSALEKVLAVLPAMAAPDVVRTADERWVKLLTVVDRRRYRALERQVRKLGAENIIASAIDLVAPERDPQPVIIEPDELLKKSAQQARVADAAELNWLKRDNGILPCIVQDAATLRVRMLGYMNKAALSRTLAERIVTFWSTSKNELWTKGKTSGNFLKVQEVQFDCDRDAILVLAEPAGPTCHTGAESCFDCGEFQ